VDIAAWLRQLGLERYEEAFRENEIDAEILPKLTADDLKDLGAPPSGTGASSSKQLGRAARGARRPLTRNTTVVGDPAPQPLLKFEDGPRCSRRSATAHPQHYRGR
jgi:hypothetical protein